MIKSQENIINDLHILWNNFLQDEDEKKKEYWVQLFLYKFQYLTQNNLSIGTSTFLNSVAFQLTSYMLQLVYGIICDSLSKDSSLGNNDNETNQATTSTILNDSTNYMFSKLLGDNFDFTYENCSLSQLILGTPNDITAIISLRKFLTNGLGGKILEFLQNCDIKFLTSRKIFATLLMNLFPNNPWEKPHQTILYELNEPIQIEKFINDFILIQIPNFHKSIHKFAMIEFESQKNQQQQRDILTSIGLNAVTTIGTNNFNDDDVDIKIIEYNEIHFEEYNSNIKTTDEIALLLINLLIQLVKDENYINLDENSITIDCFKFALDSVVTIEASDSYFAENRDLLKLKLLTLIECCLNNFFMKRLNYTLIDFPLIVNNLIKSLENSFNQMTNINECSKSIHLQRLIILEIFFLLFGLLNNFLAISNYKTDKIIDILKWFNEEKIDNTLEILNLLLIKSNELEERKHMEIFFKKIIEISLQIIDNIKILNSRRNNNQKFKRKLRRTTKNNRQQKVRTFTTTKQLHCRNNQMPCLFEKILLRIFVNLMPESKEIILRSFQKNGICCCLYNLDIINIFLNNCHEIHIQKILYKFIASRILKTIFIKNKCNICESKAKSYELHLNIFELYKNKYLTIDNVSNLLIYLKHLLKIANLLTFDISSRILVDIVLPIFRNEKVKSLQEFNNKCNTKIDNIESFHTNSISLSLNIVLECLNIFINYLTDVRLIKGFFNDENLRHLDELLYIPELSKAVCDVIRIGLENVSYLGDNPDQQINLSQRIFTMQLSSVENCSAVFIELLKSMKLTKAGRNLEILSYDENKYIFCKNNPVKILLDEKKLKISQILYMTSTNWNLTLELYKISQQFRHNFRLGFPNLSNSEHQQNINENINEKLEFDNILFKIVYNILSAYLFYHQPEEKITTLLEPVNQNFIIDLDYKFQNIFGSNKSIYLDNSPKHIMTNYDYWNFNMIFYKSSDEIITEDNYHIIYNIDNVVKRLNVLVESDTLSSHTNFNEITKRFDLTSFEKKNIYLHKSQNSVVKIFDINNQKGLNKINNTTIVKVKNDKNEQRQQEESSTLLNLFDLTLKAVKNNFPFIFFGTDEDDGIDNSRTNSSFTSDLETNEISEDFLYISQPGDGKTILLKIFESTLNAFILDNFEFKETIMQQYLQQLKQLLLSSSEKYWNHVENANCIIQALQALLKVAEMTNRSGLNISNNSIIDSQKSNQPKQKTKKISSVEIPGGFIGTSDLKITNQDYNDDDNGTILSGRISFASDDVEYHSSKASCSHQESEIEISENDTEEYYMTADEGYDADAEIQEISETDENNEELWNSFIPSSRFRTYIVHEGICKIIVEILIILSEKCIKNPEFWANSLSQLANRLFVIRQSLGGPLFLLKGFSTILKIKDSRLKDFQQSILDLITDLNTPDVLSAYLGLLTTENPPVDILIKYMAYICINGIKIQPKAEMVFPMEWDGSVNSTCNPLLFEQIDKIRYYHEYHKVETPFTNSACVLPISHSKIWTNEGITISTWIQIKNCINVPRNSSHGSQEDWPNNIHTDISQTHLISLGTNQLMLSIYVNSNLHLVFETSKPNSEINVESSPTYNNHETNVEIPENCQKSCIFRRKRKFLKESQQTLKNNQSPALPTTSSNKENYPPITHENKNLTSPVISSEKSTIANAFKSTKIAILNSFGQFNLFNSQTDSDNIFESTRVELKYCRLTGKKWTHLCFAIDIKLGYLNITTIVDGSEQYLISLPCNNLQSLIKTESFQVACIGQINNNNCSETVGGNDEYESSNIEKKYDDITIEYALSNLLIFNRSFPNKNIIANLTALGPDATNLTQCQIGNSIPNYGLLNFNKTYKLNIDNFKESIKILKMNLIIAYSVFEPKLFTGFEKRLDALYPNVCDFGVIYFGSNLSSQKVPSVQTAAILCGGLSALLFLFARIVELSQDSNVQALALDLLLNIALSDSNLYTEFVKKDYLNLISYVIRTDQCTKDVNLLKSIVNNACTQAVLIKRSDTLQVNENTNACLVYPQLLISVIRRYCDWYRSGVNESKVLDYLLKCIQSLVREKHPHQLFNLQQLSNASLIKELLNLCKIYIIEAPNPVYISTQSAELFANIISIFAGSPPSPSLIDEIMKLLLLLQKPSDCFITHDRSKFYFLISPDPPIKHKRISLPLPSKQLRQLMRDRKKSIPLTNLNNNGKKLTEFRKSSSKEKVSDKDNLKPTFSRMSMERQTTNFSTVLSNFSSLESIANCKRLDKKVINKLTIKGKCCLSPDKRFVGTSSRRSLQINHTRKLDNKNRIQKAKRCFGSKTIFSHGDDSSLRKIATNKSEILIDESQSEIEILSAKGYDIVQSDEVSSLDISFDSNGNKSPSSNRSKKSFKRLNKIEFYDSPGIVKLQEHLFILLKDFLYILPDNTIEEVLTHYVKIEILLVLANHQNQLVRAAIIRLLSALCIRLPINELQSAGKKLYWHHCANQISMKPVGKNLSEACIQWITGSIHSLDEILLLDNIKLTNKFGLQSFLAILMQTIEYSDVATKAFSFAKHLYIKDPASNSILIENGLVQVAVKSLHKICMTLKPINVQVEKSIVSLLSVISEKSIKSSGQINILWDILNLLSFYQENDIAGVVKVFRSVQATILLNLLEKFMQTTPISKSKVANIKMTNSTLSSYEIRTRFDLLVDRSSQFFITSDSSLKATESEIKLFEQMVKLGILGNTRFNNFLAWGLLPSRSIDLRIFIVNKLWNYYSPEGNSLIICDGKMLRSLLWLFLNEEKNQQDNIQCENLLRLCKRLGISENDFWNIENELDKIEMNRENLIAKQKPIIEKIIYKYEQNVQNCIDSSMIITRIVADLQNSERKTLMSQMKERDESYIFQEWVGIIEKMTHEGAPWYNNSNYSRSWELDDTEGPAHMRNRLRRCELNLNPRFIMQEYYQPILSKARPLDFLITTGDQQMNITLNSQILYNFPAKYLPVDGEIDGELVVTDTKLFFIATYRCKFFYRYCDIQKITEIWTKRYQHQELGFEISLDSNRSLFFALQNYEDWKTMKEIFYDKIVPCPDQNKLLQQTQQWKEGILTNWEYLMILNQAAGRTYNDLMQYPIFPWVLSNYISDFLDLTDRNNFRKLDKPIAVQNESNESHYINNYNYINNTMTNIGSIHLKPYHYSSHYSNSGTVLHFLVRVPPFTNYFLRYQDNNFDLPDRTFHALNTTWRLASRDSPTDVKELIPEFYCLPEMFENFEKFNFGNRQSGEIVCNVQLPPWCTDDPRTFVFIHRQALESDIVRSNLHNWIDLIFGYKQTGTPAVDAINVFHPATYPEFLISDIQDPIERRAVETMIKTYGQMPRQLLRSPHPISKLLNSDRVTQIKALHSVKGLRWGRYTGSPELGEPTLYSMEKFSGYKKLVSFPQTNVIYALPEKCCVMQGPESDIYNLISWHHNDKLIRIQSLSDFNNQSKALIYNDPFDEITTCGSDLQSNTLWFGHKSGKISVYQCTNNSDTNSKSIKSRHSTVGGIKLSYNSAFRKISTKSNPSKLSDEYDDISTGSSKNSIGLNLQSADQMTWSGPVCLVRHSDEVTCIYLSTEFKIVVSAAKDGLAVIWDINTFNYIRTIDRPSEIRHSPISLVTISPTLGDIVTVHSIEKYPNLFNKSEDDCFEATEDNLDDFINVSINPNGKSIMRLHSVNAKYINHLIHEDKILSICYSYIKEGIGINVIAGGIEGGVIRLWSSWNLSLIREIIVRPEVISLTYSTYQYLVALTDGYIQVWESEGLNGNPPKFPQNIFNK